MSKIHHSIIGLPSSGKTTFLAALWHLIDAGEIESKFQLDKLDGDHSHLNFIVEAWRECKEVKRTSLAAETNVSMHVKEVETGKLAVLHFSDLSGESFDQQIDTRTCSSEFLEVFDGDGGIFLFITADRETDGIAILDAFPLDHEETQQPSESNQIEWSSSCIPAQVKLVDILQFIQRAPFRRGLRKVAVMISAWDVIDNASLTPSLWLEREMPLLHQFLTNNSDSFEFQAYGISAQGGDVKGSKKLELSQMTPSSRITCIGPSANQHDLTSPIAWIMSGT